MKNFEIQTNLPDADFWIVRKGSIDKVGSVSKTFNAEHIGVKITNKKLLDKNYMAYKMQHVHNTGYYKKVAIGTIGLQHIKVADVKLALEQ